MGFERDSLSQAELSGKEGGEPFASVVAIHRKSHPSLHHGSYAPEAHIPAKSGDGELRRPAGLGAR